MSSFSPRYLFGDCILKKLGEKFEGIQYESSVFKPNLNTEVQEVILKFPDLKYDVPILMYLPERLVDRNRFLSICYKLDISIDEFDDECFYNKYYKKDYLEKEQPEG
jgi:hypothetical protein